MTHGPLDHLSPDDIDAYLEGTLADERRRHLTHCALCLEFARLERQVVERVAALPSFAPSAEFPERVMRQVRVPDPFALRAFATARRRLLGARSLAAAAVLAIVALGAIGSVTWTLTHQETLAALGRWGLDQGYQALWVGVRAVASNLIEQPWYAGMRRLFASPSRLAVGSAAISLLYVTGLLALRRLLAMPAPRVANAVA